MSTALAEIIIAKMNKDLKDWHHGEIDYPTLIQQQRAVWKTIWSLGTTVEDEVVHRILARNALAHGAVRDADRHPAMLRVAARSARSAKDVQEYRAFVEKTGAGSLMLHLAPVAGDQVSAPRQLAALLYELAGAMERLSELLNVEWSIIPDAIHDRLFVQIDHDRDDELAKTVLLEVVIAFDLS